MKKKQRSKCWLGFGDWLAAYIAFLVKQSICRDVKVIQVLDC